MDLLTQELERYRANPKRYTQLYPISAGIIKNHISKESPKGIRTEDNGTSKESTRADKQGKR